MLLSVMAMIGLTTFAAGKIPTLEEELEKQRLMPAPQRFPSDDELDPAKEMDFFSLKGRPDTAGDRKARDVSVEKPIIMPVGKAQKIGLNYARRFVVKNLDANKANFLLYPYNFSYNTGSETYDWDFLGTETDNYTSMFPDGAFVSTMDVESFPAFNTSDYFYWINTTRMDISKSKPLYDVNIGVLQVQVDRVTGSMDLTYESDSFCTVFSSWVWGKYTRCFRSVEDYDSYIAENPTESTKPVFSYVTPSDLNNGRLFTDASKKKPRFGILYIPDIIVGEQKNIAALIDATGLSDLRSFVQVHGGVLSTSGKGVLVAQELGLVAASTFSTRYTMKAGPQASTWVSVEGCDEKTSSDSEESEYVRRTLCFSPPDGGVAPTNVLLSGPMLENEEAGVSSATVAGMRVLAWYRTDVSWRPLLRHDESTGLDYNLTYGDKPRSYPMLLHKQEGKGHVVVNLANPSASYSSCQWTYNTFFLAGSRPLALDNEVIGGVNRTIPALERITLQVKLRLVNYFTADVAGPITIDVYTRNGTVVKEIGNTRCTETAVGASEELPDDSVLIRDKKFVCSLAGGIKQLTATDWTFSVEIVDPLVTQVKKDVVLLWPHATYTDASTGAARTMSYAVTIGAAAAGYLRADMNIDPSSYYPHPSRGVPIDNVMNCENKEETPATKVVHHSIVPLITPVIDIMDQIHMANYMELDMDYYEEATNKVRRYSYPYKEGTGPGVRDYDLLDWDLLYNRSDSLAANWDEAAKLAKVHRTEYPSIGASQGVTISDIMNANYQTTNDNDQFVLRQSNFADADAYYEHAAQRMMAFLDVNNPNAARMFHRGSVPASDAQKTYPDRCKRRVLFWRHDIFFWSHYPMPIGLENRDAIISVDRYPKNNPCGNNSATAPGAFGNDVGGLIPREWTNAIIQRACASKDYTLLTEKNISEATNGQVKIINYIVPVEKSDGEEAEDFINFDSAGRLKGYEDLVSFVKILRAKIDVYPEDSRLGGLMEFKFAYAPWSEGLKAAVKAGRVMVAADQISVYDIHASDDNNVLYIRFKRGSMPNEAYGQASHLQIILDSPTSVTAEELKATMSVYKLSYDLGRPEDNFEDWSECTVKNQEVTFSKMGGFRMPALKMSFYVGDAGRDEKASYMNGYELREPMVRYGIYEQELLQHRAIHGSAEFHPINEPCLVTKAGGFSAVTHIGTSSVPFREYVETGTSLLIPAAPETGRIEWNDMWGRRWVQNVRSTIFEYPPIPPPLRNFVMTTTYEILHGTERTLRWRSKEAVDVRVQMKILNNYPKWFEITNCKANEVLQKCGIEGKDCDLARLFDVDADRIASPTGDAELAATDIWLTQGHTANYGKCFKEPEVYLSGDHLTDTQREQIQGVVLCAAKVGTKEECQNLPEGLSTLSRRPTSGNSSSSSSEPQPTWNFAQQVEDYWPKNYIKDNMWDLTHYDYDDNWYDKAYKYHVDNILPQLGSWCSRPQNTIVFPLYKGLGYSMTYDKTYSNARFPGKTGWWSDNLQNRDHTLVAGQETSNDVSVGKESLIPEDKWIDITELKGAEGIAENKDSATKALKNVYTCRFNRRRVRVDPKNSRGFHFANVFENNVVPVPPGFNWDMEYNYDCSDGVRYTPDNISQFDNLVKTETARDWLYFAANLRGGALEDINVLASLAPLETDMVRFEGTAKVQDGGRFTYWNPVNSINSYLVVDNPVSTVLAVRNDVEPEHELLPTYATTFDAVVFHHITIEDKEEVGREWESNVYSNQYGFGDFSISVYVGDAGTSCKLTPGGGRARVKFTFNNNAGFDIDLLGNAIDAIELESKAIRADDLLHNKVSAIRKPTAYNFLNITVPPEIRDYVKIKPSEDVVGVAGLFFDFDSINVATIRDGWKGDYYLDITITDNFPNHLRGQMFEIPVALVPKCFSALPGDPATDPVGTEIHNYRLEVPPIMFGVPYGSDAPEDLAGKVFYTSGRATDLSYRLQIEPSFAVEEAYLLPNGEEDLTPFRMCIGGATDFSDNKTKGEFACLDREWAALAGRAQRIDYTFVRGTGLSNPGNASADHYIDFAEGLRKHAPMFPNPVPDAPGKLHSPDIAEYHILLRTSAPQLESGWPVASKYRSVAYNDDFGVAENVYDWNFVTVHTKGAFLTLEWSVKLVSQSGESVVQDDFQPGYEGLADITVTVTNTGDYSAYGVNFTLDLEGDIAAAIPGSAYDSVLPLHDNCSAATSSEGKVTLGCNVASILIPGSPNSFVFRVAFGPDTRDGAGPNAAAPLNMRVLATRAVGTLDLTQLPGEKTVRQEIAGPFGVNYASGPVYAAALTGKDKSGTDVTLAVSHNINNARVYTYKAKLTKSKAWTVIKQTTANEYRVNVEDIYRDVLGGGGSSSGSPVVQFICVLTRYTGNITTALAETNIYKWERASGNLFFLFLLLPAIAVPIAIASAIFLTKKGVAAKPDEELGFGGKEEFVPQEYVEPEPEPELEQPRPTPSKFTTEVEPEYMAAQPQISDGAVPSNGSILPYGPTYIVGGKSVNVVDN